MDRQLLTIFQIEVLTQCKNFAIAVEPFRSDTGTRLDTDRVWAALQAMLVAAANLSKLFWGSGARSEQEREPLRQSLGVSDTSCLRDPDLRNDFEHFDERLDQWYREGNRAYIGRNIGPRDSIRLNGLNPHTWFHHYDPDAGVVTFWDHSVSIADLTNEVTAVFTKAHDATHPPFQSS